MRNRFISKNFIFKIRTCARFSAFKHPLPAKRTPKNPASPTWICLKSLDLRKSKIGPKWAYHSKAPKKCQKLNRNNARKKIVKPPKNAFRKTQKSKKSKRTPEKKEQSDPPRLQVGLPMSRPNVQGSPQHLFRLLQTLQLPQSTSQLGEDESHNALGL